MWINWDILSMSSLEDTSWLLWRCSSYLTVADHALQSIVEHCIRLQSKFITISEHCPNLKSLQASNFDQTKDASIISLSTHWTTIIKFRWLLSNNRYQHHYLSVTPSPMSIYPSIIHPDILYIRCDIDILLYIMTLLDSSETAVLCDCIVFCEYDDSEGHSQCMPWETHSHDRRYKGSGYWILRVVNLWVVIGYYILQYACSMSS
jgi:hypothetical protein